MESLDKDTIALLSRRAFDVAASTRGVKVYLNGKRLPIKSFKDYVDLCLKVSYLALSTDASQDFDNQLYGAPYSVLFLISF